MARQSESTWGEASIGTFEAASMIGEIIVFRVPGASAEKTMHQSGIQYLECHESCGRAIKGGGWRRGVLHRPKRFHFNARSPKAGS